MAEQFLARCEFSASRHEIDLEYTVVEILLEILTPVKLDRWIVPSIFVAKFEAEIQVFRVKLAL